MKINHHKGSYNTKKDLTRSRSSIRFQPIKKKEGFFKKYFSKSRNTTPKKRSKKREVSPKKNIELQKMSIAELKAQHKWRETTRRFDWSIFDNLDYTELEGFFLEKMDMSGAFNEYLAANIGAKFFQSNFCLPLLLCRYERLDIRNRLRFANKLPNSVPPPVKVTKFGYFYLFI